MFFKKKACNHNYEVVGYYYKEYFTEYTNAFDEVNAYKRLRCKLCGEIKNILLSSEDFMPQLHKGREKRRDDYIKHLMDKGVQQEIEMME